MKVNIRTITLGNRHAAPGDPAKVAEFHRWLLENPACDLPAVDVRAKPNGTFRVHDGRHRFLAYVLAGREEIPVVIRSDGAGTDELTAGGRCPPSAPR